MSGNLAPAREESGSLTPFVWKIWFCISGVKKTVWMGPLLPRASGDARVSVTAGVNLDRVSSSMNTIRVSEDLIECINGSPVRL